MKINILFIIYAVPILVLGASPASTTSSRESLEHSRTFQDDEEFEMFYDVLREISDTGDVAAASSSNDEQEGDGMTTTTTPEPTEQESISTTEETALPTAGEEEEILEESVEEVIADYEGGLVEIIQQTERLDSEELTRSRRLLVGVAVGGAVACLLLFSLAGLAAVFCCQKRRRRQRHQQNPKLQYGPCHTELL
jgi:hypothetical protein